MGESSNTRKELKITGIVQGVGFRPFVYNLATSLGLKGYVLNSSEGVIIDVEGEPQIIDEFISFLKSKAPSLSKIENITVAAGFSLCNYTSFEIRESILIPDDKLVPECFNQGFALISPDIATCPDCLSELLNPADRRYQYPFINCTNCGPRYSIIFDIPYNRLKTTMSEFKMCPECEKEYHDPSNRRFHAQPNACHICGPQLELRIKKDSRIQGVKESRISLRAKGEAISPNPRIHEPLNPLSAVIELLKQGAIGAIKGLGGFHLACDAANDDAVKRLREKKRKSNKPFAIMCPDIDTVKRICKVSAQSEKILGGKLKPIVLLPKLQDNIISEYIAPDNNYFGVMLPYTPLHQLLLNPPSPPFKKGGTGGILVMTSGNLSEEPIVINNDEAIERLSDIADFFLLHDRDIYMRVDDSIVRKYPPPSSPPSEGWERGVVIRRARGYAPNPINLGIDMPEILGCGGELKNTFTLTKGHYAIMSQHIGDLENYEAAEFYKETLKNLKNSFKLEPTIIAHDLHPNYWTTKFAKEIAQSLIPPSPPFNKGGGAPKRSLGRGIFLVGVQHHHAHIVSCMAENHINEKVIGVAWDGTGYGTDGAIWGGEFLIADYKGFERAGYFRYTPLPGGDKAIKEPYRTALSHLYDTYGMDFLKLDIPFIKGGQGVVPLTKDKKIKTILKMIDNRINTVITSSAGRLFDAVSSIINGINAVTFEGEAAVRLEMMADKSVKDVYEIKFQVPSSKFQVLIDTRVLIRQIVNDLLNGVDRSIISAKFHNTLAEIILEVCRRIRNNTGINRVVLSGGCFQNILLLDRTLNTLRNEFKVFIHRDIPTNDGGISLGQAVIAAEKIKVSI